MDNCLTGLTQQGDPDTKLYSGQPQVCDNKRQAPLIATMLLQTPQPVPWMYVEAKRMRTQTVGTMISPPVLFQRMLHVQMSYPMRPLPNKRGSTVAKPRHTCRPAEVHRSRLQALNCTCTDIVFIEHCAIFNKRLRNSARTRYSRICESSFERRWVTS